ncbi:hypothetical protein NITGR_290025 [Nitrospina gracilis 3/211]|uniref:Uncharacterized protein n=1 Tax=Nitrospina gracilis (strain 3/211) TaxID=1266370 RepID=M1YY43_NITG3|nr:MULTISPECIES: hypothetical protein [Nitrospina]MCF8723372.1 hypothetical protein [Nitrospina sp. Nb-3]CCQ90427.1 hypothetical protein NITGR_290025 [Nitrospina gracilis 3/211]
MGYFSEIIRDSRSTRKQDGVRPQSMPPGEVSDALPKGEVQESPVRAQVRDAVEVTRPSNESTAPPTPTPSGDEIPKHSLKATQETVHEVNAGGVESSVEPSREENKVKWLEPNEGATFANEPLPALDPPFRSQEEAPPASIPDSSGSHDEASLPGDSNPVSDAQDGKVPPGIPGKPEFVGESPESHQNKRQPSDPESGEPLSIEKPVSDLTPEAGDEPPESRESALPYSYKEILNEPVKSEEAPSKNVQKVGPDSTRGEKEKVVRDPKEPVPEASAYNYEQPMPPADSFTPPFPRTEPARVPETNIRIGQIDIVVQAPQKGAKPQPTAPSSNWSSRLYLRRV